MNIERGKYKGLCVLDGKSKIYVNKKVLVEWLRDTVSPSGVGVTHERYLCSMLAAQKQLMRANIKAVSEPMMALVRQNAEKMDVAMLTDWMHSQSGALLDRDGGVFLYVVSDKDEMGTSDELSMLEQCNGGAVILHFNPDGAMDDAVFVASRIDYENDGLRKMMYDHPGAGLPGTLDLSVGRFADVLRALAFLQYADVETVVVENGQKKAVRTTGDCVRNASGFPVRYYDSRWVREIIRTEGFKVSGHFRLQPYKDGKRRLIYISEYMKHGYHRRAGIRSVSKSV